MQLKMKCKMHEMKQNARRSTEKQKQEGKTSPKLQTLSPTKRDSCYPHLKGIAHSKLTSQVRESAGV